MVQALTPRATKLNLATGVMFLDYILGEKKKCRFVLGVQVLGNGTISIKMSMFKGNLLNKKMY